MQDFASIPIGLGGEEAGQELFEADEFLVAFGQGTDSDERLTQMSQGRGGGQLIERGMRERSASRREIGDDWCNRLLG